MTLLKRNYLWLFSLLSYFFIQSSSSFADNTATSTASPKILNIGVSFAIPPWVITETDSGIELDILKQALSPAGYEVKPNYLPFALSYSQFKSDKLDGVINARESLLETGYFSDVVVTFQDIAISLSEKNYPENFEISFLKDKSIIAFQTASILLGDEFKNTVEKNMMYQEIAKQSLQINLLMFKNVDFIIMDKSIFDYYLQQAKNDPNLVREKSKLNQELRFHHLFEPTHYRFAFKSEKVRDDFNSGLAKIRKNGVYDEIFKRYSQKNNIFPEIESTK